MGQVSTIGLDIAKRVFQAHGADSAGNEVFRKKLARGKVLDVLAFSRVVWWLWKSAEAVLPQYKWGGGDR